MSKFPDWVTVQYMDLDNLYDTRPESQADMDALNYYEMQHINRGDINKIARSTQDQERYLGITLYITFYKNILLPPASTTSPSGPGLDDVDEFDMDPETPNIGLKFNNGVYEGYGLGGDGFSDIIEKHFDPYMDKPGDYDAILDAALKEVYDTFTVQGVADRLE